MKSTIMLQKLKSFLLTNSLLTLFLVAPSVATAAGTGTATLDDIKDTNYSIPAGAYFVSPDGKDTNTGRSYDSPWSVTKALALAPSEATIVFKGGIYRNIETSTIKKQLTLQAYPHEKPLLKGSIEVTGWVSDGTIWRKDGWTYSFTTSTPNAVDPNYPLAARTDMVYLDGVALKQVASKAEVVPNTFYVDSTNKQLYIGNAPAGKTMEATVLSKAFFMAQNDSSDTIIRGLGFAHYADSAISVYAPRITFENNTFVWNGEQGVKLISGTDAIVRGNILSYNGFRGLGGVADNVLVEGNTISYNNNERFSTKYGAGGTKIFRTDGLIFRNNIVEENFGNGLWMDISSTNATVVNNTVRYNESIGIFMELSHKAIIAGNVSHNNANVGILISDSSNARVYNNTLSMNKIQILVKDSARINSNSEESAAGVTWVTRNNVFINNIYSDAIDSALNVSQCQPSKSMVANTDYNAYYRPVFNGRSPILFKWSPSTSQCSVKYPTLAAFQSATGLEQHGLAVDNVVPNSFFVDEVNGDYRLKVDSPAIGRGKMLGVDEADIASAIGVATGEPVDLGALQSRIVLVQ